MPFILRLYPNVNTTAQCVQLRNWDKNRNFELGFSEGKIETHCLRKLRPDCNKNIVYRVHRGSDRWLFQRNLVQTSIIERLKSKLFQNLNYFYTI